MMPTQPFGSFETAAVVVNPNTASPFIQPVQVPVFPPPLPQPTIGRVVHLINGEHFSGAERVQQLLGQRLPAYGIHASFVCLKPGRFADACGLPAEQVRLTPMRGRFDLSVVRRLVDDLRATNPDLLHAHTPRTALIASQVARRIEKPWIYHVHSPTARDSTRGVLNRVNAWIERYALRSCSHVITVSQSLYREMLSRGVEQDRVTMVPNGVPAIEPIDAAGKLSQYEWRLGLIALMRPRKGVEIALDAIAAIKMNGLPVKLDLIGSFESPSYERHIKGLIHSLHLSDVVNCTGFTDNIPAALHRLDGLVLPSLFGEGMPMVVLEALSAGVPVIATSVEGTPEVVRQGVEGWLAEPRSAQSLANCIATLTHCRAAWREMSWRAMARHREAFSDQVMAERTAEVYKLLKKPPMGSSHRC